VFICIAAASLLGIVVWLSINYQATITKRNSPGVVEQKQPTPAETAQNQAILEEISTHVTLPGETPTFATIMDVSKLQGQSFFTRAADGDILLIFQESGRGLLYRPSTHKIIEYDKVTFADDTP
jgi:hypothetical protein